MRRCLQEMTRLSRTSPSPFVISCGTLLGGIREGQILSDDDDVDFHVLEEDFGEVAQHIKDNLHPSFTIYKHTSDELNIKVNAWLFLTHLDLYVLKRQTAAATPTYTQSEWQLDFPVDAVSHSRGKTITMGDITDVPVPNNPELFLQISYGDWKTPRYLDKGHFMDNGRPQTENTALRIRRMFKTVGLFF